MIRQQPKPRNPLLEVAAIEWPVSLRPLRIFSTSAQQIAFLRIEKCSYKQSRSDEYQVLADSSALLLQRCPYPGIYEIRSYP
jgi:hypothetical protein